MLQLNEKELGFSAIVKVEGNKKEVFKRSERESFIEKIKTISDLAARHEAMQTLDCLMTGRKVEVKDGKINLYSSNELFRPVWTITDNPELVSLLEELVR